MTRSGQMASTDSSNESGGAEAQKLQLVLAMGCTCSLELAVQLVAYGQDQQTLVKRCRGTAASVQSCDTMTFAGDLEDSLETLIMMKLAGFGRKHIGRFHTWYIDFILALKAV